MKLLYRFIIALLLVFSGVRSQSPFGTLFLKTPQFFHAGQITVSPYNEYSPVQVLYFDTIISSGIKSDYRGFHSPNDTFPLPTKAIAENGYSWFGSNGYLKQSGREVYFNHDRDSIFIETTTPLGKSWRLFNFNNGDYIEARVTAMNAVSLLGITDTLKTISLERKDNGGNMLFDPVNFIQLGILRDSGWINFVDAYHFPDVLISLQRIPYFDIPVRAQIFDFQPGDIFQNKYITTNFLSQSLPPDYEEIEILSRVDFPSGDSVQYTSFIQRMHVVFNTSPTPHFDTIYSSMLEASTYKDLSKRIFPGWPSESIYLAGEVSAYILDTGACHQRPEIGMTRGNFMLDSLCSCYKIPFETVVISERFAVGRGCIAQSSNAFSSGGPLMKMQQISYQKGIETCGDALVFTAIEERTLPESITVYPNPVAGTCRIRHNLNFSDELTLRIVNMMGTILYQESGIKSNVVSIDLAGFETGIYLVQLGNGKSIVSGRLIKQ